MKSLLKEWNEFLLSEGQAENIVKDNPELQPAYDAGIRIPDDFFWIRRIIKNSSEPVSDIAQDVLDFRSPEFQQKLAAYNKSETGRLNPFARDITRKTYPDSASLRNAVQTLGEDEFAKETYAQAFANNSAVEKLGEAGPWTILFPKTTRGSVSCDISGKETDWCTAKRTGQNLFLHYATDGFLYYIMDYNRTPERNSSGKLVSNTSARLSLEVDEDGTIDYGGYGSGSVTADNTGLTDSTFHDIVGSNYSAILNIIKKHHEGLDGVHPVVAELRKAEKSIGYLRSIIKNYKPDEKKEFLKKLIPENITFDVYSYLVTREPTWASQGKLAYLAHFSKDPKIISHTLLPKKHKKTGQPVYPGAKIVKGAVQNKNTPVDILRKYAQPDNIGPGYDFERGGAAAKQISILVASNEAIPDDMIDSMLALDDRRLNSSLATNSSLPENELKRFLFKAATNLSALKNKSLSADLVRDFYNFVKTGEPPDGVDISSFVAEPISNDEKKLYDIDIIRAHNVPQDVVEEITKSTHNVDALRYIVSQHPDPAGTIRLIYERFIESQSTDDEITPQDVSEQILPLILMDQDTPSDVIQSIYDQSKDSNRDKRSRASHPNLYHILARNKNTPTEILNKIIDSNTAADITISLARNTLKGREEKLNESVLNLWQRIIS
jgi:hypothetical protein